MGPLWLFAIGLSGSFEPCAPLREEACQLVTGLWPGSVVMASYPMTWPHQAPTFAPAGMLITLLSLYTIPVLQAKDPSFGL